MSSSAKTEKPSDKKKRDESKKGKSWRSQDLVSLIILFGGACFLRYGLSMEDPMRIMLATADRGFTTALDDYTIAFVHKFLGMIAGLLGLVFFLAAVPNLLMSRFRFASQVIKLNFGAINPIAGIKKIFALKNLKDGVKATLYLCAFAVVGVVFWEGNRADILALTHAAPRHLLRVLADLGFTLILSLLGTALFLALLDAFLEYVLYIRELKMTREEVKREHKDQNGAP